LPAIGKRVAHFDQALRAVGPLRADLNGGNQSGHLGKQAIRGQAYLLDPRLGEDGPSDPFMGNLVSLKLRRAGSGSSATEEVFVLELTAKNSLPLFWLSLLRRDDLEGEWQREIRAYFADLEEHDTEPPSLRLQWQSACAMLGKAEARVDQRTPEFVSLFRSWAAALRTTAEAGAAQEVRLELSSYANFFDGVDAFLDELRKAHRVWHGEGVMPFRAVTSIGNELTGVDVQTGSAFASAGVDRVEAVAYDTCKTSTRSALKSAKLESLQEWAATILCAVIILAGAVIGNVTFGRVGLWTGELVGVLLCVVVGWRWVGARMRKR
jgi:hypothetical protein